MCGRLRIHEAVRERIFFCLLDLTYNHDIDGRSIFQVSKGIAGSDFKISALCS
jgi:hypothetical protein